MGDSGLRPGRGRGILDGPMSSQTFHSLRARVGASGAALAMLAGCALLLTACATARLDRKSLEPKAASQAEVDAFLARGHDARRWNITVCRGPSGKPVFEFANRPWDGKLARIRFEGPKKSALPILHVETARMTPFGLLLDPTARQSWLLYDAFPQMDYCPFSEEPASDPIGEYPDHVVSSVPGYAGVANKIVFDRLHVESPIFYVPPAHGLLGPLARPQAAAAPDRAPAVQRAMARARKQAQAVMGAALMREFSFIRLDFSRREAILASSLAYKAMAAVAARVPLTSLRERPAVTVALEGQPVTAWVDLAGDFALSLPSSMFAGEAPESLSMSLGAYDVGAVPCVTHESIGLPADTPPRIGWRFWREYAVTLDFKQSFLWLEDPTMSVAAAAAADAATAEASADSAPSVTYRGITP